jgi:hypothetical protein
MASHSRLRGVRSGRLSPEAEAELALAQSIERARHARRWAYFSTVLAFFAAAGAAVAVTSVLSAQDPPPPADSRAEVRDLRRDLSSLEDRMRKSAKANGAKAEEAQDSSRRVSNQFEELETEISGLSISGDTNDRRIRRLSADVKELREEVEGLGFDGTFP